MSETSHQTGSVMKDTDCVLIHTPKFNNYYKPLGKFMWINYLPMGVMALADFLCRHGYGCRVLHQGVEQISSKTWKLEDSFRNIAPSVIGLTLHWHHQAYDVIESCRKLKQANPAAFIVLGGYTASFFHDEILKQYDCVDGIIRGDGEVPLLRLMDAVKGGAKDLSKIPNLSWRDAVSNIIVNEISYVADTADLDQLSYSNFDLLEHYRTYIDTMTWWPVVKGISKNLHAKMFTMRRKVYPLCIGRGCPLSCTWCGGAFATQSKWISCRKKIIWRSHDAVIRDIRQALNYGYDTMYVTFDPRPSDQSYYLGLFERIQKEKLGKHIGWIHEATGLTSKEFVDSLAKTFDGWRTISFSPETGNEVVRRNNKGFYYSNQDLLAMIDYVDKKGVEVELFYTFGIPGENEYALADTYKLMNTITKKYGRARCRQNVMSIEIEPGAPWYMEPAKHGIVSLRKTFADFYNTHASGENCGFTEFGYYIPHYFETPLDATDPGRDFADRMQAIKCNKFCSLRGPNSSRPLSPFWSKLACNTAHGFFMITGKDNKSW